MLIDPVIYAIFNIVNDKCYVGQTFKKNKRCKDHKINLRLNTHRNKHLHAAYNKYGKDAFIFVILENLFDTSNLDDRENYWIKALKPEYNKAPIGGSCLGFKHSQETRELLSKIRKGKKRTGEALENIRAGQKKRPPVSEEAKENMRRAQLGKKWTEERKQKRSIDMIGNTNNNGKKRLKPMSRETRAKIAAAHRRPQK